MVVHDFKSAQPLETRETPVAIIDPGAMHGFCMAESIRYKRQQEFVKKELGEYLLSFPLRTAVINSDNCDFEPSTAVATGDVHVCTTCVAMENSHVLVICHV